ncbi:MAG: hypothetical protein ACKOCN_08015 [Planctomycetaceae bacterium]
MRLSEALLRTVLAVAWAIIAPVASAQNEPHVVSERGTSLFGMEARGHRFVYVLDRSASTADHEGVALRAAKKELLKSLDRLDDVQQFQIVFYNHRPRVFTAQGGSGRLVFAGDSGRRSARRFVESIAADGGTDHAAALEVAARLRPDAIFLVTDGDQSDDLDAAGVRRLGDLLGGTRLMVVQFVTGAAGGSPRLAELAASTGGESIVLDPIAASDTERQR